MAPFAQALEQLKKKSHDSEQAVFECTVDPEWCIGAVPHGGYLTALILLSCIHFSSSGLHKDPIHLTAHFLRATSSTPDKPITIHVKAVKKGKSMTNLAVELRQNNQTNILSHLIFGTLSSDLPQFSTPLPLSHHPAHQSNSWRRLGSALRFRERVNKADDPILLSTQTQQGEYGTWVRFPMDRGMEEITLPHLAFIADIFLNLPQLLASKRTGWHPTLFLSVEFKSSLSLLHEQKHSKDTVGLFSKGRFLQEPQGRHDTHVELWTAPNDKVTPSDDDGWKANQRCLCIAQHVNLIYPMEFNLSKGKSRDDTKL